MGERFPTTCRAAVFASPGQPLHLYDFDVPRPNAGEAIVRVDLATVCGSDLHTIAGKRNEATPTILGHEIVGTVEQVGDPAPTDLDGQTLVPGDRITWAVCASCGQCDRCQRDLPQKCRQLFKYGHQLAKGNQALSGGMAEALLLRSGSAAIKLSAELPDAVASPANCATATIAAAYRVAGSVAGHRVLIIGAGMLGLTAAAFADHHQAASVTVCDVNLERIAMASRFGATQVCEFNTLSLASETSSERFDTIIECSGAPDAVEIGCRLSDIGATIILVGSVMNSPNVQLDPQSIVRGWLSIHGVHNYAPVDLQTAVRFLEQTHTKYPFESLVEKSFHLADVNQAVQYARDHRPIRVALCPKS